MSHARYALLDFLPFAESREGEVPRHTAKEWAARHDLSLLPDPSVPKTRHLRARHPQGEVIL